MTESYDIVPVIHSRIVGRPDDPIEAIVWCEEVADWLDDNGRQVAEDRRFEAAQLMYEQIEVEGKETQRSLAEKIGKHQRHVLNCIKVHKIILEDPGLQARSWSELYQQVKRPALNEDDLDEQPPTSAEHDGDEWYTPSWLFNALGVKFALDVCAPLDRTYSSVPADDHLTIDDDGLSKPWSGTVWCNPPYSKPEPWARRMIHHGDGLLLTHMPINAGWCTEVWEACDGLRLFQAMEFLRPDGTSQRPGYWLALAAFGPIATEALARLQPLGDAAFNKRRVASPMWKRVP